MPVYQQPTTAPQAPAAPALPTPQAPSQAELQQSIREQVRKSVEDAKAQSRAARDAAHSAGQNAPVVVIPGNPYDHPDWVQLRGMGENIAGYFFITVAVIAIGVPLVRAIGRRFGPAPIAPPLPKAVADQLQRIETAVESMAIEVERISEAQRFLTKLQTGQPQPAALPPRQGS